MQDQSAPTQANPASYVDAYLPPNPPTNPPTNSVTPVQSTPDPLAVGLSKPITDPQAVSLPKDPAVNDQDAQKALDDLAKMFETVDDRPPTPDSALNGNNNPAATIAEPVTPPPVVTPLPTVPSPAVPSVGQTKNSDQLLKEIEQALEDKRSQKPAAGPASFMPSAPIPPPVLKPAQTINPVAPLVTPKADPAPSPINKTADSESLEDQNIFYLLGIDDGSQEQKDQFLNELQQVIWEDFLDHDVELLLTDAEYKELREKYQLDQKKPLAEQEEVIVYLEKLIPDLENLMLEKAIKLKADLVKERITSLRERFASDAHKLTELERADGLLAQDKWLSVARTLNSLQ